MARWLYRNHVPYMALDEALAKYSKWEVWEDWNIPKGEFIRWWRLGIEAEEIYAKGPVIAGAREALWRLSDAEWDIHIATSRLSKFGLHDKIVSNTATWLRDNNIPYRQLSFVSDKHMLVADAIVDDVAGNMSHDVHNITFLFPANHNTDHVVIASEQQKAWLDIVEELI